MDTEDVATGQAFDSILKDFVTRVCFCLFQRMLLDLILKPILKSIGGVFCLVVFAKILYHSLLTGRLPDRH